MAAYSFGEGADRHPPSEKTVSTHGAQRVSGDGASFSRGLPGHSGRCLLGRPGGCGQGPPLTLGLHRPRACGFAARPPGPECPVVRREILAFLGS